jgi:DNA-binding response OmpR family regulator
MNGKTRILVVEDETPVAMMMVHILTRAGCDVQAAHTGRKGMEIAQEQKFDLILLEVKLPDISGLKICADLRQRHISYRTPVIFLSNQCSEEYRERALALGAADFVEKPLVASDFVSRILSHLEETALS